MGNHPTENAAAWARVCLRIPALFFWTMAWYGLRMAALPLAAVNAPAERALRRHILRAWARGVCAIVRARVTVRGAAPAAPFVLVSNHLSYFDPIVYARVLGCVFVSMAEVGAWPLVGVLARSVNTLFIDRKRRRDAARVNGELRAVMDNGHGVLVFPESTTSYGDTVLPFHGALLQPAVERGMPVHFAAIAYATPPAGPSAEHAICWVDDTPFAVHALRLLRLRRFVVTVTFGAAPVVDPDRKRLAAVLQTQVGELVRGRER